MGQLQIQASVTALALQWLRIITRQRSILLSTAEYVMTPAPLNDHLSSLFQKANSRLNLFIETDFFAFSKTLSPGIMRQ
jgi:hypothetical protein